VSGVENPSLTQLYGYYSCRARGERKKRMPRPESLLPDEAVDDSPPPSSSWAASMKRIFEINPLECPRCNATMRIVAFIHNPEEISKIMDSLGLPKFRAPPKIITTSHSEDFLGTS